MGITSALAGLPVVVRAGVIGALVMGVAGAVAGLVVGLVSYAATAWFAVLEVGVPAAIVGWVLGLAVGSVIWAARAK
jgi:hypothetical protein